MKIIHTTVVLLLVALFNPTLTYAADSDKDRSSSGNFVKDSVITTKIKAKLAADKLGSFVNIHVETDKDGAVLLTGNALTQESIDKATVIAKGVEGVTSVNNNIAVKNDL